MIDRPIYLQKLIDFKDKELIKVITGIRRCGKSSLLELFAQYLWKQKIGNNNIIKINFESLQYANMTYIELNNFIEKKIKKTKGKIYLLLDEIQKVHKWELTINSLRLNKNLDIYITGSNAYLLSSELSTYLAGRYVEIKVHPLIFKEFLNFYKFPNSTNKEEKFDLFFKYGGMPGLAELNFKEQSILQTLEGIFATVLTKDIINKSNIREPALLNKIINFLADNIGNSTSINNIKNTLVSKKLISKGISPETIDNYILFLQNAFVFYNIKRYDIKGKEYLSTQNKYYMIDMGLRNYLLGFRNVDRGHILENIVFLELMAKGYNVSIGKIDSKEIDFIATTSTEKKYIQVCENLGSKEIRNREITPLENVRDNYEKIILTMDKIFVNTDINGIKILNIIDWLS